MSAPSAEVGAGEEPETLQTQLEDADDVGPDGAGRAGAAGELPIADPVSLFRHLDVTGRFHRDSGIGRLFHPGRISYREDVGTDSLHVVVEGNQVAAHVDAVSPLVVGGDGPSRYSVRRALSHNLVGMVQDLVELLRGRQGDHRCELRCEWVSSDEDSTLVDADLLDPPAWSVQLEARVAGRLDEARLRAALGVALGRQSGAHDPLDVVDCHDDGAIDEARARLQSMAVPVTQRPPLHVCLARHPAGDVLMLNLNHGATDGFGALTVLHAIARAYAGDAEPEIPFDFLALSDLPVRPAPAPVSVVVGSAKRAVERVRDVLARPTYLASDQPADRSGYGFHLVRLSGEDTRSLVGVEPSGTTENILITALHLAMSDWNLQHAVPGRRLRVLVPANLRPSDWPEHAIGNFSVTARVSTSRRHRAGPASTLQAVAIQTARNKRIRTGVALIAALARVELLPLWAKQSVIVLQPLTGNRLIDNAVLCHLGWQGESPWFGPDAGETVELWFSTPPRSAISLSLGAVSIGGRLNLTFRYPHRLFSPDAARRFADGYLHQLRLVQSGDRP